MSQTKVDRLLEAAKLWQDGDLDRWLTTVDPDVKWTFRDGLTIQLRVFETKADALTAVGLAE